MGLEEDYGALENSRALVELPWSVFRITGPDRKKFLNGLITSDVVKLAATLEQVATDTYLSDLAMFTDVKSRMLMASVMGVECQHLATLRAVGALLQGGAPELIAIPS